MSPAPSSFTFEPLFLALVAVAGALYLRAARAARPPAWRIALFSVGLLLIAGALNSPLETIAANYLLLFHLLQNVMIADWAPPLLILGLLTPMVLAVDRLRIVRRLAQPAVAMLLWLVAWYAIHVPVVYDYALEHRWALGVEHLVFIVTGLLFWWAEIVPGYLSPSRRVLYLFIALVMMMPLDFFIALYPSPLYSFYEHTPKLGGASALTDQRIAGAVAVLAETAVFAVALFAAAVALRRDQSR